MLKTFLFTQHYTLFFFSLWIELDFGLETWKITWIGHGVSGPFSFFYTYKYIIILTHFLFFLLSTHLLFLFSILDPLLFLFTYDCRFHFFLFSLRPTISFYFFLSLSYDPPFLFNFLSYAPPLFLTFPFVITALFLIFLFFTDATPHFPPNLGNLLKVVFFFFDFDFDF